MVAILAEEFNDIYWAPRPHGSDLPKLAPGSGRRQDGKTTRVIFVRNEPGDGSRAVADHDGLTRPDPGEIRAQMCLEFRYLRILHDHKMTINGHVVNRLYELGLGGKAGWEGRFNRGGQWLGKPKSLQLLRFTKSALSTSMPAFELPKLDVAGSTPVARSATTKFCKALAASALSLPSRYRFAPPVPPFRLRGG